MDKGLPWAGQYPAANQQKDETRDIEDKSKGGCPSPPSNHSFKFKDK